MQNNSEFVEEYTLTELIAVLASVGIGSALIRKYVKARKKIQKDTAKPMEFTYSNKKTFPNYSEKQMFKSGNVSGYDILEVSQALQEYDFLIGDIFKKQLDWNDSKVKKKHSQMLSDATMFYDEFNELNDLRNNGELNDTQHRKDVIAFKSKVMNKLAILRKEARTIKYTGIIQESLQFMPHEFITE